MISERNNAQNYSRAIPTCQSAASVFKDYHEISLEENFVTAEDYH